MSLFLMTMWPGASRFSDLHGQTPVRQDTLSNTRSIVVNARKIAIGDNRTPSAVPLLRTQPYPSGYVDSLLIRCFTHMDSVIFSPQQKFWQRDGISGNDGQDDALYGFSVPLVGDLNGDGKPEIVALSIDGSGVNNDSPWLYIINGQTGAVLNKYTLPAKVEHCVDGFHGSPCQLALIDADRNGLGEIIVCFNSTSTTSSSNYGKQIASFEIVDKTKFTLSQKWKTSVRYDAWGKNNSGIADGDASRNYDYPIPHIVDINGDGTPELIVYNKIYNAKTGAYIMKLEDLGKNPSETTTKTAYIGSFCLVPWTGERNGKSHNDTYYESSVAFPSIYDIDGDGKYDYIAGGKIYYDIDVTSTPGSYKILNHTEIPDGRTAVADIDGDGKAEIVVQTCNVISQHDIKNFTLKVWKPDFQNNTGKTVATVTFRADNAHGDWGYSSYLYIGDIDGKEQNGKKLPEISMICGRPFNASESTPNMTNIPVHPNVQKANGGDGLITQNMSLSKNNVEGCLISFTWDLNGTGINDRLKVSFMLEHEDRSVNTGFSLFDFDNDGTNEICYRDEQTLRILSAKKSFVMLDETDPNVIRMKTPCLSYTAYEYPSIADVDNDGSADMIVIGRSRGGAGNTKGYILVVGGANSDLAPAPAVWNQFHYHPMKINKNLQTPPVTFHPLDPDYCFYINDADANPTYTYNSNIMQAVISASFKADNGKEVIRSIVYTPDAKIINARITVSGGQGKLTFMVTNTGNASLDNHTPISIYWDNGTTTTSLNPSPATVDKTIYPGDTVAYTYTVPQASDIYHIIVGDGLLNNGELKPGVMRECNWADNYLQAAIFLPREDLAVVPRYGTVLIDVLANDILEGICSNQTLTPDKITVSPNAPGVLSGNFGSIRIVNNKIMYTAPGALSFGGGVLDFTYRLTCGASTRTAHVYVYIIESCTGSFETCADSSYTVCLTKVDSRLDFRWYDEDNTTFLGMDFPHITKAATDVTYYVKPDFRNVTTGTWAAYMVKDFPAAKITVKVAGASGVADTMRWTGAVDRDWLNPNNWVQVAGGKTKSVTWAPAGSSCVDVILGKDCPYYPELKEVSSGQLKVECRNIHLEDRAMIAGIHLLSYKEASMDFEPVPAEKDRFVMWSAPLKDMYTGDYHFPGANGLPDWGAVYMNFFQSENPDIPGSVAREKTYTATFGSMGTPLPLGKTFNVNILPDTDGRRFTFPKTSFTSYTGADGKTTGTLARAGARRFITDGALSAAGELDLPVDDTYELIQVVNPFAAYLKVDEFLSYQENKNRIENTYKMWSGDVNEDFVTLLAMGDTMRYMISDAGIAAGTEQLIAPFQSFFVTKKPGVPSFKTMKMNARTMVTTAGSAAKYTLRNSAAEKGVLRITAKQQSYRNATVLLNEAGAVAPYDPDEDSRKAFLDGVPVSVYTITAGNDALAINRSGDFDAPVRIGIRLRNTEQPVTLDFSGAERFGRSVYLVDHESGNMKIDLREKPSYTFVVPAGMSSGDVTELNDRFSLNFGAPEASEKIETGQIRVYSGAGRIHIDFPEGKLSSVTIYDAAGATVYRAKVSDSHVAVPVPPNRLYLVKTYTENRAHSAEKVLVLP